MYPKVVHILRINVHMFTVSVFIDLKPNVLCMLRIDVHIIIPIFKSTLVQTCSIIDRETPAHVLENHTKRTSDEVYG